ncbi:unnamed protein product, partial [Coregonus sp. 'balchen']
IQEGTQCTKCKNEWALKTSIALLYVLCTLLTIAVENVSEGIESYGGKIIAVETDLKKLDDQTGEKSENTTTEIQAFKNNIRALQRQLSEVAERSSSNRAALGRLQDAGLDMQGSQGSIQGLLDANTATLRSVNGTLRAYGGTMEGLQEDTARLQTELQEQVRQQSQALLSIGNLNLTQAQQRGLISALQRSVDDTSQAIQKIRNDFQSLEQTARQTKSDTDWLREKVQNLQVLASNASALAKANNDSLEDVGSQLASLSGQLQNTSSLAENHDQTLREIMDQQRDHDNLTSSKFDQLEIRLDESEGSIDRVTGNISFTTQLLGAINLNLNELRTCAETVGRHSDYLSDLNATVSDVRSDATTLRSQQDDLAARLDKEVTSLSIIMEEMKLVHLVQEARGETKDPREEPVSPVRRGRKGIRVGLGCRGSVERRDLQDHQEYQGSKVSQAHEGIQGQRAPEGQGAGQDPRGRRVSQARLGSLGETDSPVLRGHQVCRETEDRWGRLGHRDPGDRWDLWGPQGHLDCQDSLPDLQQQCLWSLSRCRVRHPLLLCRPQVILISFYTPSICLYHSVNTNYDRQDISCPQEWVGFRDKCYHFSKELHNFDDAKKSCDAKTASMVIINDMDEQKWLQKQTSGKGYFWMGLTDREEENAWRWLDGTEPAFSQWKPGQPDNWSHGHERGEDCAGLIHEG